MTNKIDKALITKQKKKLQDLDDAHLACRVGASRHMWTRVKPDWTTESAVTPMAYQCSRCLTVKRLEIDPKYGLIIGRSTYEYPPDYLIKRDDGEKPITSNAVRAVYSAISPEAEVIRVT